MAGLGRNRTESKTEEQTPADSAVEPAKVTETPAPGSSPEEAAYADERYAVAAPGAENTTAALPEVEDDELSEADRAKYSSIWWDGYRAHEGVQFGRKAVDPYAKPVEEGTSQAWTVQSGFENLETA